MCTTAPVIIVGTGPSGLSASIALARHGVRSLVIEVHPGTSTQLKATALDVRTMELFRAWGVDDAVLRACLSGTCEASASHALAASEIAPQPLLRAGAPPTTSLVETALCDQDALEQILREHARTLRHADIRSGTELVSLEQDHDGVCVTIVDRATGMRTNVRARYLIAADRAASLIRAPLADRFRDGRVFLAGETARRTTPSAAAGLNSGIHDAHNLAWKLAAVMQGWAGDALLDSYEAERRPGAPGCRAPHVWLESDGRTVSTLDLWNERFVLLTGDGTRGDVWAACAWSAARDLSVPFRAFSIGPGGDLQDRGGSWHVAYGIEPGGAVLVRPDGRIGWRARRPVPNPIGEIADALSRMLGRDDGIASNGHSAPAVIAGALPLRSGPPRASISACERS